MKTYLWMTTLALTTVWATGCIIIDADRMESHKSAMIRSEECVIRQGVTRGTASELHPDTAQAEAAWVASAE
ncbi:MAG: hypothetical protein M1376_01940 [Planctomycetes bacterium]|nr:hypothetical protein [Planctomycetota bacterium]